MNSWRSIGFAMKLLARRSYPRRTSSGQSRTTGCALTVPAQRAKVKFEQDALDLILDRADVYPCFLQQWGETIWRDAAGPTITLRDAETAEDIVNDELDRRFFRDRYEKAPEGAFGPPIRTYRGRSHLEPQRSRARLHRAAVRCLPAAQCTHLLPGSGLPAVVRDRGAPPLEPRSAPL